MMVISMKVKGLKSTRGKFKKAIKNIPIVLTKAKNRTGIFMQGKVKDSIAGREAEPTSVDTGAFLNSVNFKVNPSNVVIFSPLIYAKFLEFGRGGFRGRRHFENTKNRNKAQAIAIFREEVKK